MRLASDSPTTICGNTKHHISNRMKRRAAAPQPKANTNTFTDILVSLAFDWLFAPPGRIRSAKSIMICVVVPVIRVVGGALRPASVVSRLWAKQSVA